MFNNADGGSLPGPPRPIPDYREPAPDVKRVAALVEAGKDTVCDYRLASNLVLQTFGAGAMDAGLASAVDKLLRVNRQLAIRLYGRPCDLDGELVHPMWNAG